MTLKNSGKLMKENKFKIVYYFAAYVMLMGITGYLRTSATMPLYLNGSIALITTLLSFLYYNKQSVWKYVLMIWISLNFLMYSYMTLFGVSAHPNPTVGTYLIFGSMAVFSLLTFVMLYKEDNSKQNSSD